MNHFFLQHLFHELHSQSAAYSLSGSKLTLKTDEGDLDFTISSAGKTISESEKSDFTYTILGNTVTFTVSGLGEQSGTFSEDKEELKMTIKGNELTYKKL